MRNLVLRIVLAVLALGGAVVSVLALQVHYMDPAQQPPCGVTEHFDCGAVNHSRFAVFPPTQFGEDPKAGVHIPVAVFGIAGYSLMALLALAGRFWMLLQFAEIGFGAACLLTYLEAFVIQKWCIYCLCSQGIVTAILIGSVIALLVRRRTAPTAVPAPARADAQHA